VTGKELVRLLEKNGWVVVRINGSHHIMKKESQIESVPVHGAQDVPLGTLRGILKRTGLE
jgi:predicted RNA binding protein YcfA (HicA-like mRNA interferase family)